MNAKPYVVGITGSSGSGKTFFLNSFLNHFRQHEVSLLSQDDYYIPVGDLTPEENKLYNFDVPSTIDHDLFTTHIDALLTGQTVYKQEYTFNNPNIKPKTLEIKPAPILVIEGLFILHFKAIADIINLKLFIDADEQVALKRRIKRDNDERGYSEDDVMYKWQNHVVPAYQQYLLPYKHSCHQIIVNNQHAAEELITIAGNISARLKKSILS